MKSVGRGIAPVPGHYDVCWDTWTFRLGGKSYTWKSSDLPFTIYTTPVGKCADSEHVLEHGVGQSVGRLLDQ
jgi:hypothetical protein